jgi:hypothetical protein
MVFSSTNKTDRHDITEILLKVALNTIILTLYISPEDSYWSSTFNSVNNMLATAQVMCI